jgi:hypothetical protein
MIIQVFLLFSVIVQLVAPDRHPVFVSKTIDNDVRIGYGVAIGDIDGDGKPDVLLADKKQFVWYRNGDWKKFVLAENLTVADNVCIAARDIDGDGKVEIAVGAQWNPAETSDTAKSGAVFFLLRPDDPTRMWKAVALHHEPTVHRIKWIRTPAGKYQLIVLPLHGRGNADGNGKGVRLIVFDVPEMYGMNWRYNIIETDMHLTHNLDVVPDGKSESFLVAGKEGIKHYRHVDGVWAGEFIIQEHAFGELRQGSLGDRKFIAAIEPMHGNVLSVYFDQHRQVLTQEMKQGHAVATADFLKKGSDQIVAGWREPDADGKVGIKLYSFEKDKWIGYWIDENEMACEDIAVADLDGDEKKDIIAAGRSTHNLKIYWNKN